MKYVTRISHTRTHTHTHTHTHIPMCFYRPFVYAASSSRPFKRVGPRHPPRHTWRPNQGGCMYIERSCMAVALCSMLCSLLHAPVSAPCSMLCSRLHADRCLLWPAVACCLVVSLPSTAYQFCLVITYLGLSQEAV